MSADDERWLETGRLAELGLLSAELSHELRQPLFAVKALAQLMERSPGSDPRLAMLLEQIDHMEAVVDRWSATGRRPAAAVGPVDLVPAVQAGVQLLQARARNAGKSLSLEVGGPAAAVLGDSVAIQQITTNLVSNALDAARSRVRVVTDGPVLRILDDGPGIPDDVRARIFEPFYSTKPPGKGTGLGLAITAHLVRGAGAALSCQAVEGGTLFEVTFARADGAPVAGVG